MVEANPRISVRARAIIIYQGQLLLVQDEHDPGYCYLPGGGVEFYETAEQAVRREFAEECDFALPARLDFAGTIENRFRLKERLVHEILFHFSHLSDQTPPQILAREKHLQFAWVGLADIAQRQIRPAPSADAIGLVQLGQQFFLSCDV